jgi:MFS family permease
VRLNRIAVKIAFFLNGFIYSSWVARLPRIQELYNADDGKIAVVLFAMSLGALVAMPFTGWVIIRHGSRRITLVALILYCIFVPLIPFMPGFTALLFLYLTMGIATGMLDVAMNAQAVMIETAYQRPIMTSFHALFSIGMALGPWCAVLFTKLQSDLSTHFSIVIVASLIAVFWVSRNLVHDRPDPTTKQDGPLFRVPNKALLGVGIIAFCCMMGEGAMSDWTVNYMENIAFASKLIAPIALSAFAGAMTIGRIFGDRIRASWGDTKLIMAGGVMASAGLALTVLIPLPAVVILGAFLVGLGLSTIVPIAYSIAGNEKGLPSGVGISMVTTIGYSGFLFGAPIIGFIADTSSLRVGLSVVIILFIIMTYLGFARMRQTKTTHGN